MAGQVVGQLERGSQVSMPSFTPLSHLMPQSRSLVELQPLGQHPSSCTQVVWLPASTQVALQVAAEPWSMNFEQPRLGQDVGQVPAGSHSSPDSITLLPHLGAQSESLVALQLDGQHPSFDKHAVCWRSLTHAAVQVPPLTSFRSWQPIAGQAVGQLERGSQVSMPSFAPLSHLMPQSRSFVALHPVGQHPSSCTQVVWFPASTQVALQVAAEP
jgi:hypothetical protein